MIDIESLAIEMAALFKEESDDSAILVAGQALAAWGVYYLSDKVPMEQLSALASRDVDFYNTRTAEVKRYALLMADYLSSHDLQMDVFYPEPGDPTINVGKWLIKEVSPGQGQSEPVEIDFINFISGLNKNEINRNVDVFTINDKSFEILSPVLCLKARINNLLNLYPTIGKSAERMENEEQRIKLGMQIVRCHLNELILQADLPRLAHTRAGQVLEIAKSSNGRRLYAEKGISVLEAIPNQGLHENFYKIGMKDAEQKMKRSSKPH